MLLATFVPTLVCTIAARFRLVSVEFIFPLNVTCRAIAATLLRKRISAKVACISPALHFTFDFLSGGLLVADAALFRGNFLVILLVVLPIAASFFAWRLSFQNKSIGMCQDDNRNELFMSYFLTCFVLFPTFYGLFISQIYEMKLFHQSYTMSKQQNFVLQAFQGQNNGVVLLQKTPSEEEDKPPIYKLRYRNQSAQNILNVDENECLTAPVLKPKENSSGDEVVSSISSCNGPTKSYSIADLVDIPSELVATKLFTVLKQPSEAQKSEND